MEVSVLRLSESKMVTKFLLVCMLLSLLFASKAGTKPSTRFCLNLPKPYQKLLTLETFNCRSQFWSRSKLEKVLGIRENSG